MSLIPDFEIGVWNAWILMLYFPLHPLIMILIDKAVGTGDIIKKMGDAPYTTTEKRLSYAYISVNFLLLIYSVFLPLKTGTPWFYIGLPIYLLGFLMFLMAIFNIATTPHGEPFAKGLYRYSRHPMFVSGFLTYIGVSIASASWLFLLVTLVTMILLPFIAIPEERGCLEQYGNAYRDYLDRTPRWLGIPKELAK